MDIKNENFKRISSNRLSKIITLLSSLTNLSNYSFYEYTDEEIESLFNAIQEESMRTKDLLLKANEKRKKQKKIVL